MSSAMNHKKRSCYSEQRKGAAFRASSRQAFYRTAYDNNNRGLLSRISSVMRRKVPQKPAGIRASETEE